MPRTLPLSSLLLSSLLLACGGTEEGADGRDFPVTTDSVNLDGGAHHAGSELLWGVKQLNAQSPRLVEIPGGAPTTRELFALAGLTPPAFVDCNPIITGYDGDLLRDTDADGIPDDYKVDYGTACVSEPEVGAIVRVTISGSRRLQDSGHGFRSFRVTIKDLVLLAEYLDTGALHRTVLNGVEEGRFAAGGATYSTDVTIVEFTSSPGEPDREWFRHLDLDLAFTPAAGHPLTFNAPLPQGTISLGGAMQHVEPEVVDRLWYTFLLDTPSTLQWSSTCHDGDFVGGTLRGRYNGSAATGFQVSWGGCTDPTLELFGYME